MQIILDRRPGHGFNVYIDSDGMLLKVMKLGKFLDDNLYKDLKFNERQITAVANAIPKAPNGFKIGLKKSVVKMKMRDPERYGDEECEAEECEAEECE